MKTLKKTIPALMIFVALYAFPVGAALAEDKLMHVYYSEPLGAGNEEKVYRVTACKRAPMYEPLKCIQKVNAEGQPVNEVYFNPEQCIDRQNNKVRDGEYIKGCVVPDKYTNPETKAECDIGKDSICYPKVDETLISKIKANQGCSDAPAEQGYLYGTKYGVVDKSQNENDKSTWILKGTVVWDGSPDPDYLKYTFGEGKDPPVLAAEKIYKSVLCVPFDVLAKDGTVDAEQEAEIAKLPQLNDIRQHINVESIFTSDEKCVPSSATIFDGGDGKDSISCTIQYRVSGASGTEIFANYVGKLYTWAASIVGIIAVLFMVWAGIQISMAGGDSAKIDEGKKKLTQAIIGIAILFLSGLILYTINPNFFTGG